MNIDNNNIVLVGEEFLSAKIPLSLVNNKQIVALFGDDENFKNVNLTIFN